MKSFNWEDFRHFAALARTLNLGQAAASLNTSAVTVMRRVKALEAALDVALFVRRRDGHRLTPDGTKLLALAGEAEHVFETVSAAIGTTNATDHGHVRIATTEVGANWLLLPHVAAFREQHPGITLEVDASPRALDLLEDTETLALRFARPRAGPHVIKRLGIVPFGLYASPEWLRNRTPKGTALSVDELPYIGWAGPFAQISLARWLRSTFAGRSPALAVTTLQGHVLAAQSGIGVTALPAFIGRQLPDLIRIPVEQGELSLEAWLVVPAQTSKIARIRIATRFIEGAVRRELGHGKASRD